MEIWSWICELANSAEWDESNSPLIFPLAVSKPSPAQDIANKSIQLRAERNPQSDSDTSVTLSVCLQGFNDSPDAVTTLWVSDPCPLSSTNPFLPLVLQLLQEIISRSPTAQDSTCPRSQLQKLKPDPVSWILDSHSPESVSIFFNLIFLTRLFWLCACDGPAEAGSLCFHSLLAPNLETFTCNYAPVLRTFLVTVGVDAEVCFMRTLGYMLAKWMILREVGVGLQSLAPLPYRSLGFSYAMEVHGLWVLKGYSPVWAMPRTSTIGQKYRYPVMEAKESVLRYALAHQQLEAVIQLEYTVSFCNSYIQVNARVDNLRLHVAKLGFKKKEGESEYGDERHFPSRVRVWVGPEVGATYVGGLSLGRSTDNAGRETETQRIVKGSYGKSKAPKVKATARTATRMTTRNWRWDQDAEGNAAVFDAVLCDNTTGVELATWKPSSGGGGREPGSGFRKRYTGANRAFTKTGGMVFGREEWGEGVGWRLSKEMEGSVLKWRIGGQVWLSYLPNEVNTSYFDTRTVEWCDEVDLPLIPEH